MGRILLALSATAVFFLGAPGPAQGSEVARTRKLGLGGMAGNPTAFTLKYHFTPHHALTGAMGIGWWGGHNFEMHVDYGYHFDLARPRPLDVRMYVGGGVKFFYYFWRYYDYYDPRADPYRYGRAGLGLRGPVGVSVNLNKVPLEIFGEIAPGVAFLPWIFFFVDGSVGVRYYF